MRIERLCVSMNQKSGSRGGGFSCFMQGKAMASPDSCVTGLETPLAFQQAQFPLFFRNGCTAQLGWIQAGT
jgi:hypothetical protein